MLKTEALSIACFLSVMFCSSLTFHGLVASQKRSVNAAVRPSSNLEHILTSFELENLKSENVQTVELSVHSKFIKLKGHSHSTDICGNRMESNLDFCLIATINS